MDIIVSFIVSILIPLPKMFVQIEKKPNSDGIKTTTDELLLLRSAKVALSRTAVESIYTQQHMGSNSPYRTWARLIGQDIVEVTLEIPRRYELLQQWGITIEEQEFMTLAKKDTVTVNVAFPISLLPDDIETPKTVLDSGALGLLVDSDVVGLECVSRIIIGSVVTPILLFAHGGGYTVGTSKESVLLTEILLHHESLKEVPHRFMYASITYSLSPEHPFPNAPLDATSVSTWFLERSSPKSVHLIGVSAGGGLMLSAYSGILLSSLPQRPASVIAVCPMLDPSCDTLSFLENETSSLVAPAPWLRWSFRCYLQMPMHIDDDDDDSLLTSNHTAWKKSIWYRSSLRQLIEPIELMKRQHSADNVKIVISTNSADPLRDGGISFATAINGVTHLKHKGSHFVGTVYDKKSRTELQETLYATVFKNM